MSFSKALCVLCECPTADGAVLAVHVDKDKLQHWALNVCGHELAHEIEDEDQICYFCVWQAELNWKFDGMSDEEMVWWPRNEDFDDAAKELRKHYFEGSVEQCWVRLEKIELPECTEQEKEKDGAPAIPKKWRCLYCGNQFKHSHKLAQHTKNEHPEAIRCQNHKCATYFHTLEERESHQKEVHEKPKERKVIKCNFCVKEFEGTNNYKRHVRKLHREFPVKCSQYGCLSFFKTKIEMEAHFDSVHALDDDAKKFRCDDCGYNTRQKISLKRHISRRHLEKYIKCEMCVKVFATESLLQTHVKNYHTFKDCSLCQKKVTLNNMQQYHLKATKCNRCKSKFQCSGLFQSHLQACKQTLFKCSKCSNEYKKKSLMDRHVKKQHVAHVTQGKKLGFKCAKKHASVKKK